MIMFFILQLVNVIFSTIRSICTVTASKHVSAIMNAVSYTFYAAVVKFMTEQPIFAVVWITFATNIIGVYIADWIMTKMKKDKIWQITVTIPFEDFKAFHEDCQAEDFAFDFHTTANNKYMVFILYAENQMQSIKIKNILNKYSGVKYFTAENIGL